MKPSLQLRIGQQLSMTPQLQQAIRLLQLSAMDLQTEIQQVLETNLMLELQTPAAEQNENESAENTVVEDSVTDDTPWDYQIGSKAPQPYHESSGNELETLNSHETTLKDHLTWQMQLTPFTEQDKAIALAIIDAINDDGFLCVTIDDIIKTVDPTYVVEAAEVEAVLHRIQRFDPVGVGARSLGETLSVQLAALPSSPVNSKVKELLDHHLDLLAKHDYTALKRRLGLSMDDLKEVIQRIQSLNPRPGNKIGERKAQYIVPDVYTFKKHGIWQVELNPECTPQLQINRSYQQLIKRSDTSKDNQFLRNQLQEARWFLKSVENRHDTLLRVARMIVKEQQAFLEHGEEAMKPMILHDISQQLDLHESTVSRITQQKYLHTPRGTYELKYFFSSCVTTESGEECSATAIRALIKKLIHDENPNKPLSDSQLTKLLANQGIIVARRTIAKYREAMTIPPSHERKQLV